MAATADRVVQGADEDDTWRIGEDVDIWDGDDKSAIRNLKKPWAYDYPWHYADRWWGSQDSKEFHAFETFCWHRTVEILMVLFRCHHR